MSLNLNPKCKESLVARIAEQLPKVVVNNGMFLDLESMISLVGAEQILPHSGKVKEALREYIGESSVFEFVFESLSKELYDLQEYSSKFPKLMLTDIEPYVDPVVTASKLIDDFDSLPRKYCLTIKFGEYLSKAVSRLIGNYPINASFRIATPNDEFCKEFPLISAITGRKFSATGLLGDSVLSPSFQKWDEGKAYIQVDTEGFIGKFAETAPVKHVISDLKAFFGLAIALRLFKLSDEYLPTAERAKFFIHQNVGDSWEIQRTLELNVNISDTFNKLDFHDLDGKLDNDAKRSNWALFILNSIKTTFSGGEKAERIMLASQWLYDSHSTENELLAFVLSTVVLEILLGDKAVSDIIGLGELLRNRCAYLIGKSQQKREEILKDFKEIYDVRSKIVHRGYSRLRNDERKLLRKLQWMCRRVIQEEIKLLEKDLEGNT